METLLSSFQTFVSDLSQSLNIDNDTLSTAILSSLKKINTISSPLATLEPLEPLDPLDLGATSSRLDLGATSSRLESESSNKIVVNTVKPKEIKQTTNNKCENLGCTKKYKKINKFFDNSVKREINVCTNCFRKLNSKTTNRTIKAPLATSRDPPVTPKISNKNEKNEDEKEPGEINDENDIQNIDFHFGNEPSVSFTEENKKWWKCKTIIYFGKKYKLHLNTNLVFKVVDKTPILYGLYRDNEIHPLEVLSDGIIEWCDKSGIEIPPFN